MIVIGASLGASKTLPQVLGALPSSFPDAIAIVVHRHRESDHRLVELLQRCCPLPVEEVTDKIAIERGRVYVAPADYHLQVEAGHFELSTDEPVNFARPSIDVLFESAANAYGPAAVGIILTGANADGAAGLAQIKRALGKTVVQDPADADCPVMPQSALALLRPDHICRAREMAALLVRLCAGKAKGPLPG
jgi:two-component system, chemotaxis family, protein-glutamate methylesterase/glutaminase